MLPTTQEARGPKYFTGDAQTCPGTARDGQAARAEGVKPEREDAGAQVDTKSPSQSHAHAGTIHGAQGQSQNFFFSVPTRGTSATTKAYLNGFLSAEVWGFSLKK